MLFRAMFGEAGITLYYPTASSLADQMEIDAETRALWFMLLVLGGILYIYLVGIFFCVSFL